MSERSRGQFAKLLGCNRLGVRILLLPHIRYNGIMNSWFNKFADKASRVVSHAAFFAVCVLTVILWAPSFLVVGNIDTWQLIINTLTTIITFLLVALLQNTQQRFEDATNQKLNALAMGIGDLLEREGLTEDAEELYDAYKSEEED